MSDKQTFPYDIFLSHNRAQKGWTEKLGRRLRDDGFKVWFDDWELPKSAGHIWPARLEKEVNQSRKVALIWSPEFFTSEWPQFEASVIEQIDPDGLKERVIPILHTTCKVPEKWEFRQRLDFTGCEHGTIEFEFRYQQLLHNLDHLRPFEDDFECFKELHKQAHRKLVFATILKVLLLTSALFAIKLIQENMVIGKSVELATYTVFRHRLSSTFSDRDLPVMVVDISDLEQSQPTHGKSPYTSRRILRDLIAAAAAGHPRAIGLDLDFSPDENGYITPQDPEFFQFCLDTRKNTGIPIFLGIHRSLPLSSSAWLGESNYQELAAAIIIPKDNQKMPRWLQVGDNPQRSFSISASLAGAFRNSIVKPIPGLNWAVESESEIEHKYFSVKEFVVDYAPLEALESHRLRTAEALVIRNQSWQLRDKIVLFGDATRGRTYDTFAVPGQREPIPGVLIHACAVNTLLREPLYALTAAGRLVIDLLLSLLAFGGIAVMRGGRRHGQEHALAARHLPKTLGVSGALLVVLLGWGFVWMSKLMWDDFLLLALVFLAYTARGVWRAANSRSKEIY